jgi:hypothetical protein
MLKLKFIFPRKGSVLVFSLVILAFLLVSALSVAVVSVTEKRASFATDRSNRSFQVADSGAELILQKIYKGNAVDITTLASNVGGSCVADFITGSTSSSSGTYKISLYDDAGAQLACGDLAWRSKVARLRSEGTSGNTVRAVEVAVAAAKRSMFPGYPDAIMCDHAYFNTQLTAYYASYKTRSIIASTATDVLVYSGAGSGANLYMNMSTNKVAVINNSNPLRGNCGDGTSLSTMEANNQTFYFSDSN